MDLRNGFVKICYGTKLEEKEKYVGYLTKDCLAHFDKFENWFKCFGTNYLASNDKPSVSDFHLFEMVDCHVISYSRFEETKDKDMFEGRPLLKAFYERFRALK